MRPPGFWRRDAPSLAARLLQPVGFAYGAAAGWRMGRAGGPAPVPVLCIGNFTLGGAGKTPTALALARLLQAEGRHPAFLSRGYGGRLTGPVRVDPARHDAAEVGDEPLLLARAAPTVVARDRPAGARLAAAEGADIVIMDDGLQNPSLAKDLSLAVVDAETGIGNGLCFPAGPLRAPLPAQWRRVDALVLIGEGGPGEAVAREAARNGKPVLGARLAPDRATADGLRGRRVLAFAGIGRPEKFFAALEACGAVVVRRRAFPDHYPYRAADIQGVMAEAAEAGLLTVTTEKDRVRLDTLIGRPGAAAGLLALPVRLALADEDAARDLLRTRLATKGAAG